MKGKLQRKENIALALALRYVLSSGTDGDGRGNDGKLLKPRCYTVLYGSSPTTRAKRPHPHHGAGTEDSQRGRIQITKFSKYQKELYFR